MKIRTTILACIAVLLINGCSNKQWYEGIQSNRLASCEKEPNHRARSECARNFDQPYEDYQRERVKLTNRDAQ